MLNKLRRNLKLKKVYNDNNKSKGRKKKESRTDGASSSIGPLEAVGGALSGIFSGVASITGKVATRAGNVVDDYWKSKYHSNWDADDDDGDNNKRRKGKKRHGKNVNNVRDTDARAMKRKSDK